MAAALLRSQRARLWADILTPAAETSAAGALWQVIAGRTLARVDELRLHRCHSTNMVLRRAMLLPCDKAAVHLASGAAAPHIFASVRNNKLVRQALQAASKAAIGSRTLPD